MTGSQRTRSANGRSSIYFGADGRWHGWVSVGVGSNGTPVRRHVTGKTQAIVTEKVKRLEADRDQGVPATATRRPRLSDYLGSWIERRELLRDVRPTTIRGYRTDKSYIDSSIGNLPIDKIRPANVEACWAAMVQAGRVASVGHARRTLSACLSDAVADGLIARNPVRATRVPKYDPPETTYYTVEEVRRFLAAVGDRRNRARWSLAALLGLRQGEALALAWDDYDEAQSTLNIRRQVQRRSWLHGCADKSQCSKRGAGCPLRHSGGLVTAPPKSQAGRRPIPLPPLLVDELVEHRKAQVAERLASEVWEDDGDWMFPTRWGSLIDHRKDWQEFKDILVLAGLRPGRVHDLRHSAATVMIEAKIDYATTGAILGHSSITQTSRYVHVLAERKRAAADAVGDIYGRHTAST